MYPPTHVSFAYLVGRKALAPPVSGIDVWLLIFFTVLPDLVDKTVHYHYGFLASGRNIFHNIFIVIISYVIYRLVNTGQRKRLALIAFLGLSTHFAGDLIPSLIGWTYKDYSSVPDWFLYTLFPIFDPRQLPIRFDWFGVTWELIFNLVVIRIWIRDGHPGLAFHRTNMKKQENFSRNSGRPPHV